ncbi:type II secretion system F family protein [Pseudomonas sp. FW300-N2F2]|uniref:type II secretion system F family protein n=1 Tax=Pseudomonas sp. FW300-N2F2 TaxID=2751320 RepID=UPI001A924C9E|nr:type II secretion system F family protein [Pseudomonas sp. FW300-N2F2]
MTALLDLLTLMVFIGMLCGFFGLRSLSKRRQRELASAKRLATLNKRDQPNAGQASEFDSILRELKDNAWSRVPVLGGVLGLVWLNIVLLGWRKNLGLRLGVFALVGMIAGAMLGRETPLPMLFGPLIAGLAAVASFALFYNSHLAKYHKELKKSLPEAIDAITRTCRAGVPVSNAFALVAEHITGPLALEFRLIDHWLRLGVPLRRVMQDSALRVPLNEYRFFAVILIINQEAGGRLGETLDRLASTLRDRHELQLKVMSKTSEARASAKIVASLVPAILGYMYLNSPGDFHFLLNDATGNIVLFYALGSVVLGMSITQVMVRRVG